LSQNAIMKRQPFIRTLLGATQNEMSLLLHISRSQWAMYELGLRDLPAPATKRLAEILAHLKSEETPQRNQFEVSEKQLKIQQKQLERLLKENEYQQQLLSRKIAILAKQQEAQLTRLQLAEYLKNKASQGEKVPGVLHQNMTNKALRALATQPLANLMTYEMQQELLILQRMILESKTGKITRRLENRATEEDNHFSIWY